MRWLKTALVVIVLLLLGQWVVAQEKATLAQQFYVLKLFNPKLKKVGVITSVENTEKIKETLTRACLINGLKAIYVEANGLHQLGDAINSLVQDEEIGFLWIPPNDPIVSTEVAMKYILKKAVLKGVPTCVPDKKWLNFGGTLYVGIENGKVRPYFNTRLVEALGMKVPEKYTHFATAEAE